MKSPYELHEAIGSTIDSLEIDKRRAILIGGAGLAAYGIITHRGVKAAIIRESEYVYQPFDVDALLPPDDFAGLREYAQYIPEAHIGGTTIDIPPRHAGLLPFTGVVFDEALQHAMYREDIYPVPAENLGTQTLEAHVLATHKNDRSEPRDTVGLVLGHKDAYHDGNPVAWDARWQEQIYTALRRARSLRAYSPNELHSIATDFAIPRDFIEAVENNFRDEAFNFSH